MVDETETSSSGVNNQINQQEIKTVPIERLNQESEKARRLETQLSEMNRTVSDLTAFRNTIDEIAKKNPEGMYKLLHPELIQNIQQKAEDLDIDLKNLDEDTAKVLKTFNKKSAAEIGVLKGEIAKLSDSLNKSLMYMEGRNLTEAFDDEMDKFPYTEAELGKARFDRMRKVHYGNVLDEIGTRRSMNQPVGKKNVQVAVKMFNEDMEFIRKIDEKKRNEILLKKEKGNEGTPIKNVSEGGTTLAVETQRPRTRDEVNEKFKRRVLEERARFKK